MPDSHNPHPLVLVGPSLGLFLLSLALPAISYIDPYSGLPGYTKGYTALTEGWMMAFPGLWDTLSLDDVKMVGTIAWFANPVLPLAWILLLCHKRRAALIVGRTAFFLGVLFFVCVDLPIDHSKEMRDMHGSYGFYVWMASMAAAWYAATRLPSQK